MSFRTLLLKLHLWLGLATGLVLAVVCFTGAALVFEEEIVHALYPGRYTVAAVGERRIPLDEAAARVREAVGGGNVTSVTVHADPTRTYELAAGRGRAFVDPYTGEVLATGVERPAFFTTMFGLHRWLLARDGWGKQIVGVSTIAFLFILVSGAVLWVPRTGAAWRARLSVAPLLRARTRWRRRNHDLHVVLGIYAAPVLFVLAFTGLAWSFTWFNDGIYKVTRSPKAPPAPESVSPPAADVVGFDAAYARARGEMAPARFHTVRLPADSTGAVTVSALPLAAVHDRATDALHLDRATGAVLRHDRFAEASLGVRVRRTFYPVHVGSIWGLPSRIVAFVACLLGASFPITGFVLWVAKWRQSRRRRVVAPNPARRPAEVPEWEPAAASARAEA